MQGRSGRQPCWSEQLQQRGCLVQKKRSSRSACASAQPTLPYGRQQQRGGGEREPGWPSRPMGSWGWWIASPLPQAAVATAGALPGGSRWYG